MKTTSLLVGLCLLLSTTSLVFSTSSAFSDVPDEAWYADAVDHLAELRVLQGNPDGSYRPEEDVNRAELAVALERLLEYIEDGKVSEALPTRLSLEVPFSSQAPTGDWSMPYQEACEEAALVMVQAYWNQEDLTPERADEEILKVLAWEEAEGYGVDVGVQEISKMAQSIYDLTATIYTGEEVTTETMKSLLAAGYPIILPTQGTVLQNPNYTGEGPVYHMIVLVGYTSEGFLTNDPGTQNGAETLYSYDVIEEAIHDWTGSRSTIEQGDKAMVVLQR